MRAMHRLAPLWLLTACGTSAYYPDYPDWLLDTGRPGTQVQDVPCSAQAGTPSQLTVTSTWGAPLRLGMVDPWTCAESFVIDLESGGVFGWQTTTGTVWTARSVDGDLVDWFEVPAGADQWAELVP